KRPKVTYKRTQISHIAHLVKRHTHTHTMPTNKCSNVSKFQFLFTWFLAAQTSQLAHCFSGRPLRLFTCCSVFFSSTLWPATSFNCTKLNTFRFSSRVERCATDTTKP